MVLPREMATQRRSTADVSAPGVRLWSTATTYVAPYRATVVETDLVTAEDVALAIADPPELYWDIEAGACCPVPWEHPYIEWGSEDYDTNPYDLGVYGEGVECSEEPGPPGIYQNFEFGEWVFGEGPFGGIETVWNVERPRFRYDIDRSE